VYARMFFGLAAAASLLPLAAPRTAAAPQAAPAQTPVQASPGRIAWFGTWEAGLAEARRSGRPILLIAAAPHCHNVSGLW